MSFVYSLFHILNNIASRQMQNKAKGNGVKNAIKNTTGRCFSRTYGCHLPVLCHSAETILSLQCDRERISAPPFHSLHLIFRTGYNFQPWAAIRSASWLSNSCRLIPRLAHQGSGWSSCSLAWTHPSTRFISAPQPHQRHGTWIDDMCRRKKGTDNRSLWRGNGFGNFMGIFMTEG